MSKAQYSYCNNCGAAGHAYHQCKLPISSFGIVAYRMVNRGDETVPLYLMIRRKDSLGFVDFVRGKYRIHDVRYIKAIVDEMTNSEKEMLISASFRELWTALWGYNSSIQYRGEEKTSHSKFSDLRKGIVVESRPHSLHTLVTGSKTNWAYPEWGFPKGRRNYHEKEIDCAMREFTEETGYAITRAHIVSNVIPYQEVFTGSNFKSYKHCYFLAELPDSLESAGFQKSEVGDMAWVPYREALSLIRPYNMEKKQVLINVHNTLLNYTISR